MGLLALSAVSCRARQPAPEQSSPLGMVETSAPIGPSKMSLEQVQAEVEAFADQYVLQISEATNQAARSHPEARPRLHAIKLSIARGAYIIASGPNPVVSVLDLVVQATLVHRTAPGTLARSLPEEIRAPLVEAIERLHNDAWRLAERVLTPQDLTDLRSLIDAWIEENPNAVYVAGVRFSDFARLRPTPGGSSPTSIFGLLRVDPFASIDPAAREIQESRLLAERMFYYVQRMPQLLAWDAESLYFDIARAPESQQLLTSVDAFAKSAEQLNQTIAELPTRTREELAQSEETVSNLLSQMNAALDQTSKTLAHVDQSSSNLRDASQAVADAGKAWEATADADRRSRDDSQSTQASGRAGQRTGHDPRCHCRLAGGADHRNRNAKAAGGIQRCREGRRLRHEREHFGHRSPQGRAGCRHHHRGVRSRIDYHGFRLRADLSSHGAKVEPRALDLSSSRRQFRPYQVSQASDRGPLGSPGCHDFALAAAFRAAVD